MKAKTMMLSNVIVLSALMMLNSCKSCCKYEPTSYDPYRFESIGEPISTPSKPVKSSHDLLEKLKSRDNKPISTSSYTTPSYG
ncbi:hypothetical protein AGMMS49936_00500 [Endomicrobiia bacterium]|nr:hypothetical protein AGMMS49936_00500 [Endomicrobiia bacterium]